MEKIIQNYMNIDEKTRKFHKNIGKILRYGVHIEDHLETIICEYFIPSSDYQKMLVFRDWIINPLPFERKKQIVKEICKEEHIDKELLEKTLADIKFIQELRNKAAHAEVYFTNQEFELRKKARIQNINESQTIDDKIIEEADHKRSQIINNIRQISGNIQRR